jgi:hypothetical protein
MAASVGDPACSRSAPSVSAADFSALYERCMKSSLKARVAFHHAAGRQTVAVTCTLPASTTSAATAVKRRRRCPSLRRPAPSEHPNTSITHAAISRIPPCQASQTTTK